MTSLNEDNLEGCHLSQISTWMGFRKLHECGTYIDHLKAPPVETGESQILMTKA